MKATTLLLLVVVAVIGQEAAETSKRQPRRLSSSALKPSERVFYFRNGIGDNTGKDAKPRQGVLYKPNRGERVFFFKDSAGVATEKGTTSVPVEVRQK